MADTTLSVIDAVGATRLIKAFDDGSGELILKRMQVRNPDLAALVKHAVISFITAGDNPVVALVAGKRIKVLGYVLIGEGAVRVTFKSNATALSGAMNLAADGNGIAAAMADFDRPWLTTAVGEALNLHLDAGVQVSGHLTYFED